MAPTETSLSAGSDAHLDDPEFYVWAAPEAIERAMGAATSPTARRLMTTYLTSREQHHRCATDPDARRWLLVLDAVRLRWPATAESIAAGQVPIPRWATGYRTAPARLWTSPQSDQLAAFAVAEVAGRPTCVIAGEGGLRSLPVDTQAPMLYPPERTVAVEDEDGVPLRAVACFEADGRPCALTGSASGRLRLWDLETMAPLGPGWAAHDGLVCDVAVVDIGGEAIGLSLGEDDTLRQWRLSDGGEYAPPLDFAGDEVARLASGADSEGRPLCVVSTWGHERAYVVRLDEPAENSRGPRTTALRTSEPRILDIEAWPVATLCTTLPDGRSVVVVSAGGPTQVWDLDTGSLVGELPHSDEVGALAVATLRDRPVIVGIFAEHWLVAWDADTFAEVYSTPLPGRTWEVTVATVSDAPMALCLNDAALPGEHPHEVTAWTLDDAANRLGERQEGSHRPSVVELAHVRRPAGSGETGGVILASTGLYGVRGWDCDTGAPVALPGAPGIASRLTPIDTGSPARVVVSRYHEDPHVWDVATGRHDESLAELVRSTFADIDVEVSGTVGADGRAALVAASTSGVVVWDADTRERLASCALTQRGAPRDLELTQLADGHYLVCVLFDEGIVIAVLDDAVTSTQWKDSNLVRSGLLRRPGRAPAVVAATETTVNVVPIDTGVPAVPPIPVRSAEVRSLTCAALPDERQVVVVGHLDGTVDITQIAPARRTTRLTFGGPITSTLITPDGDLVVAFGPALKGAGNDIVYFDSVPDTSSD